MKHWFWWIDLPKDGVYWPLLVLRPDLKPVFVLGKEGPERGTFKPVGVHELNARRLRFPAPSLARRLENGDRWLGTVDVPGYTKEIKLAPKAGCACIDHFAYQRQNHRGELGRPFEWLLILDEPEFIITNDNCGGPDRLIMIGPDDYLSLIQYSTDKSDLLVRRYVWADPCRTVPS